MFKLFKINDHANAPYYSISESDYFDSEEIKFCLKASQHITNECRFNAVMEKYCDSHPYGVGFDDHSSWGVPDDLICVIEFMDMDMDEPCVRYEVVEYFYSHNDCNAGIIYDLPYVLHFVEEQ